MVLASNTWPVFSSLLLDKNSIRICVAWVDSLPALSTSDLRMAHKKHPLSQSPPSQLFLSGHLENLISLFIIQHFIHNKYKLFTATVKKAHLHGGSLWALTCARWCRVIRPGEKGYLFFFFKKEAYIFTTLFLKIKLAALPKNILKYNKRVRITLRLWETQIHGQFG